VAASTAAAADFRSALLLRHKHIMLGDRLTASCDGSCCGSGLDHLLAACRPASRSQIAELQHDELSGTHRLAAVLNVSSTAFMAMPGYIISSTAAAAQQRPQW
jgi:hypothetical protein